MMNKKNFREIVRSSTLLLCGFYLVMVLSGCQQMGTSEVGIVFRKLPPELGGGVSRNIAEPGKTIFVMPWESVYRFDTSVRSIEWGLKGADRSGQTEDYVHTRAKDGNEVALAVKIQYRVSSDPEKLLRLVKEVATSDEQVEDLVSVMGRSDIRTYMSELNTAEFFGNEKKYEGELRVRAGMEKRLAEYGIEIQNVNLKEHRFERVKPDGSIDRSYQEKINEVQEINESTRREELRKETVLAQKVREYNDVRGEFDRTVAESQGYLNQAKLRGEAYFGTKKNEAEAVRASGEAQVKGMVEQINALSGPGGEAILKLELAKSLREGGSAFVLMSNGSGAGLSVNRFDANDLIKQAGIFEAMNAPTKSESVKQDKADRE